MKKLFFVSIIVFQSVMIFAQEFQVPMNYKLETEEECIEQESNILAAINWLNNNPMNVENVKQWESVYKFLWEWAGNVPYLSITFGNTAEPAFKGNAEIGIIYVGGYVQYALTTREFDNKNEQIIAGIEAIVDYYTTHRKELKKNSTLEKFVKLQKEEKLREYILKNERKNASR